MEMKGWAPTTRGSIVEWRVWSSRQTPRSDWFQHAFSFSYSYWHPFPDRTPGSRERERL